jgi:hypothetical protein
MVISTLFLEELRVVRRRGGVRMCSGDSNERKLGQNGSRRRGSVKGLSLRFALPETQMENSAGRIFSNLGSRPDFYSEELRPKQSGQLR